MTQNNETLRDRAEIEVALLLRDEQIRTEALKVLKEPDFWQSHSLLLTIFACVFVAGIPQFFHFVDDRLLQWLVPAVMLFAIGISVEVRQLRRRQNALIQLLSLESGTATESALPKKSSL